MYRQQEAILGAWEEVTNTNEAITCFKDCRAFIDNLDNSDLEPDEEGYLDAGQANLLRALNTKMYKETLEKTMHPSHTSMQKKSISEVLAPSHDVDTVETIEATTTTTESTMNIESMSLSELAELQVKIAARMQELINNQVPQAPVEVAPIEDVIEETKQMVERHEVEKKELSTKSKGAARVKKASTKHEETTAPTTNEVVVTPSAAPTYKEMQKYISAATKSNPAAKAIAQRVAKERGQRSWSTTGSVGYAEIYNQIIKL